MVKKTRIVIVSLSVNLVCLFILILFPSPSRSEDSIVSMGDSITNCSTPTCIYNHCVGVGNYEECYVARLSSLLGILIDNLGVGGSLSRDGLAWIDGILSSYRPQILTIYYGTNDAHQPEVEITDVYDNLQMMVRHCKNLGTKPILATIGPQFGNYYQYKSRIDTINGYIRSIVDQESIPLADIESALHWNPYYMYDEIHPNTYGHEIIANTFYQAMIRGCAYTIDPASVVYSASGGAGSITVGVVAGTACPWKAVSNVDWITVTAGSPGIGDGTIYYLVTPNQTNQDRTGTVTVAGKTFTVTQKRMVGLPWLQLLLEE